MIKNIIKISFLLILFIQTGCRKHQGIPPPEVPVLSDKKAFLSFGFKKENNPALLADIHAEIGNDTISAKLISGISADQLIPYFTFEGENVSIDTDTLKQQSGVHPQKFTKNLIYHITAEDGSRKSYTVVLETDIPVMHINTNGILINSKEEYIDAHMKIDGNLPVEFLYDGKMRIRGRGNFTWGLPKKPYKIKLDQKTPLLGINSDKTWVLMANYADKSMMRNEVAFEISRRIGLPFIPKGRFIEVILNDQYQGTYQLIEQIEVATHKVNVEEQNSMSTTLPDISGGYLVEADGYAHEEPVHFFTNIGMPITVKYPDDDKINSEQVIYIKNYIQNFEDALFSDDFADPETGYRKYFDVDAYIDYLLVNEIVANPDAFWSTYFLKKRNSKLMAGPVWDFDLAGNYDFVAGDMTKKMVVDNSHRHRMWIERLMEDATFRQAMRKRWNEIKADITTIPLYIDELSKQLKHTQKRNFEKWPVFYIRTHLEWVFPGSFEGEVSFLRKFLVDHIKWLDTHFQSEKFD